MPEVPQWARDALSDVHDPCLVTVNIRLSAAEMAEILDHSGASLLVATHEFADRASDLARQLNLPCFIAGGSGDSYEAWIEGADPAGVSPGPIDERQILAINYTSGTTGRPKGVIYHHRGGYLQATAMAYHARLGPGARYLWTLPMFHCNGWCFTWAVTAAGGTHVCLRAVDAGEIWRLLRSEGITHFSAAPTILTMIAEDAAAGALDHEVHVDTGGAPPSATLLARMGKLGFAVTHLYGLTETYGPLAINEWQPEWDELAPDEQATLRARQGAPNIIARPLRVLDKEGRDVRTDGETTGKRTSSSPAREHRLGRGGKRPRPSSFGGGKRRRRDAGRALGEVPVAFVMLRSSGDVDAAALADFAREHLARYKVPKRFEFRDLPKNSTGKIQKNVLRDMAKQPHENS